MRKGLRIALYVVFGLVLILAVTSWNARFQFDRKVSKEIVKFHRGVVVPKDTLTGTDLQGLPQPVRRWLEQSGVVGRERTATVRLKQRGEMRSSPDGSWMPFEAEQYVNVQKPAFIWKAAVKAAPLIEIMARDRYEEGKGNMMIKLQSLITIADSRGAEIDQGSMVRYLAEIAWYPSAALSKYVTWDGLDSLSARATMSYGGASGSGTFRFDGHGDVAGFEAMRYRESNGTYSLEGWSIAMKQCITFDGIRIPSKSEVTWKSRQGNFTWLRLEITDLEYNRPEAYAN